MTRRVDLRQLREDDRGTSLIELVVGMLIMVVFMTIFTGAVFSMTSTANKVEAITTSTTQINDAFLRLDKMVRYADAITDVGTGSSGDWYVELDTTANSSATETCDQLRINSSTGQLQLRTWIVTGTSTYTSLSHWIMLASNLTNGAAASGSTNQPFVAPAAPATGTTSVIDGTSTYFASARFQRLSITLVAATAGAPSTVRTRSSFTFTALNSSASATTNSTQCQQLGTGANRP